jgi:hypothetical protein
MVRWIVFDDDTADAVVGKYKRGAAEIRDGEDPVDAVLALDQASAMVLPSRTAGRVLLARFEPKITSCAKAPVVPATAPGAALLPAPAKRPTAASRPNDKKSWWRRPPA